MNDNYWVELLQQVGFPIFVVLWFMFRTEKIIQANTEAVQNLTEVVAKLAERIE